MNELMTHTPETLKALDHLSTVITSERHGYTAHCPELGIEGKGPTAYDAECEMLQAVDDYLYSFDDYDLYQEMLERLQYVEVKFTGKSWTIEPPEDITAFILALDRILPAETILYFEGTSMSYEVFTFFQAHKTKEYKSVRRESGEPTPGIFHIPMSKEILEKVAAFIKSLGIPAVCDHMKAYLGEEILLYSCDQFYGWPIFVSQSLPEERVQDFCKASGSTYFDPYASEHAISTKFEGGV